MVGLASHGGKTMPIVKVNCGLAAGGSTAVGVVDVKVEGTQLVVTKADNSTQAFTMPKAEPANVGSLKVLNADGSRTVAIVATLE